MQNASRVEVKIEISIFCFERIYVAFTSLPEQSGGRVLHVFAQPQYDRRAESGAVHVAVGRREFAHRVGGQVLAAAVLRHALLCRLAGVCLCICKNMSISLHNG